jgi:hypothetical protein
MRLPPFKNGVRVVIYHDGMRERVRVDKVGGDGFDVDRANWDALPLDMTEGLTIHG